MTAHAASLLMRGLRQLNGPLLLGMLLLVATGVLFINSASSIRESAKLRGLYLQHAETGLMGLGAYLVLAAINYRSLARWSALFYAGSVALLAAVPLIGTFEMGARRWVFGIQPSEFAKLSAILLVAWLLGRRDASRGAGSFFAVLGLLAVPVVLVLAQPDLGTALVFVPTIFAMLFASHAAPRAFWATVGIGALAAVWVVSAVALAETSHWDKPTRESRLRLATGLRPFQQERLAHFIFPGKSLKSGHDGDWNKHQSEIAVGSGGLWGKGFRKGDQNMLGYLPQNVSCSDFIFSVLAEEAGFAGALAVLALFALVIGTVLVVASACPDGVGKLLCVGVGTMMFVHVFVNIAMTVGLLPITGLPLPFISNGRTCLLTMMMALGFVQSVAIHGRQAAPRF